MVINCNILYKNVSFFDKNACFSTYLPHLSIRTFDKASFKLYNEATKLKEAIIMSNKIQYCRVGDYLIPNLILPFEEASVTLGKWGMMHKTYLEKHEKVLFSSLLMQGKLYQHCAEVETPAKDMFETLVERMKKAEGVTEKLKEENQLLWVQKMGNIQARAREIVCNELIYN